MRRELTKKERVTIKVSDSLFGLCVAIGGIMVYYKIYQYLTTGHYGSLAAPAIFLSIGSVALLPKFYSVILKKGSNESASE